MHVYYRNLRLTGEYLKLNVDVNDSANTKNNSILTVCKVHKQIIIDTKWCDT